VAEHNLANYRQKMKEVGVGTSEIDDLTKSGSKDEDDILALAARGGGSNESGYLTSLVVKVCPCGHSR
jgi:hypothetical protein